MQDKIILEGLISVFASVEASHRKIYELHVDEKKMKNRRNRKLHQLISICKKRNIKVRIQQKSYFQNLALGNSHGGVIAFAGIRTFLDFSSIEKKQKTQCYIMLDGIEDPFNLGYAIRSMYAFGIDGVVIRNRDWSFAESIIMKSSAGTWDKMPLFLADSAEEAAIIFQDKGFRIACTGQKNAISLFDAKLDEDLFILIGGERRGITRSFLERTDFVLEIPYARAFSGSLTASNSTAIIAAEIFKQKRL